MNPGKPQFPATIVRFIKLVDGVNSRNVGVNTTMVDVHLVKHLMNSSMVDVNVLFAYVESVKQRVKSVSVGTNQPVD